MLISKQECNELLSFLKESEEMAREYEDAAKERQYGILILALDRLKQAMWGESPKIKCQCSSSTAKPCCLDSENHKNICSAVFSKRHHRKEIKETQLESLVEIYKKWQQEIYAKMWASRKKE